jgi:hypothetical protein
MNRREALAVTLVSGLSMTGGAAADEMAQQADAPNKPVLAKDQKDNVRVRLVGVRRSDRRGRNLEAKFQTLEKEPETLFIHFPAHSFTTHEQTLSALIRGCVAWDKPAEDGWAPAVVEADFSIPQGRSQPTTYSPLEKAFLVELRLPQAASTQPKR